MSQPQERKDVALAYALWCLSLVGICGVQRLYLGQVGYGLVLLLSFGFCGIAQLLDLILLPAAVGEVNGATGVSSGASAQPRAQAAATAPSRLSKAAVPSTSQGQDDDLDALLREARSSVARTKRQDQH